MGSRFLLQDADVNPQVDHQQSSQNLLSLKKEDLVQSIQSDPVFYADLIQQLCRVIVSQKEPSQASPTIVLDQTQDQNSIEFQSLDEINDTLEQNSVQIEVPQTIDCTSEQSDLDIADFLARDPVKYSHY